MDDGRLPVATPLQVVEEPFGPLREPGPAAGRVTDAAFKPVLIPQERWVRYLRRWEVAGVWASLLVSIPLILWLVDLQAHYVDPVITRFFKAVFGRHY